MDYKLRARALRGCRGVNKGVGNGLFFIISDQNLRAISLDKKKAFKQKYLSSGKEKLVSRTACNRDQVVWTLYYILTNHSAIESRRHNPPTNEPEKSFNHPN